MKKLSQDAKGILKSKTMWFGLAIAILPFLESFGEYTSNPQILTIIGLVIMGLRYVTNKPLSVKKPLS